MVHQSTLGFRTRGRGTTDITAEVAHARSVLTSNSLGIPVSGGRLLLGTWQGLYLYEHRTAAHERSVVVTVMGER